ncbi:sugar transferase [Clostridium fessum]|uniref:sugar transferase n=1 Tax=Clostridium fessum TaxID=2126740 RepID=UPI0022E6C901|nr:sugar transferase [Clostridium fessum]
MSKKKLMGSLLAGATVSTALAAYMMKKKAKKTTYEAVPIEGIEPRKMGIYEKYVKRAMDVICATGAIVVFSPLYLGVAALVKMKLGSPVLFVQERPGLIGPDGKETIFKMYKFRTMTDEKDENGELLPDDVRLTKFGAWLRNTSLDELPEVFNILNGTMSIVGPRPQLVRDMTFMTEEQRRRHTAKPGLSGLAQVNGRNAISWEEKLSWDLKYIEKVSFSGDIKIIAETVKKAFIKQEGITQDDMATAEDFGDYLLRTEKINKEEYQKKQEQAQKILNGRDSKEHKFEEKYSVLMSLYKKEDAGNFKTSINSMIDQTLPPDEIVLVEDGALTKELYDAVNEIKKAHPGLITSVINKQNMGLGISLQRGTEMARNEIIARMDTDDIANIERCEKQLKFLNEHKDVSIVGGQIEEFIGDVSNVVGRREVPLTDEELKRYIRKRCPFNHMTVMFRKSDILDVGNYQDWFWNEDYYLWIRLLLFGKKFANLPDTLVKVRTGNEVYQRRGGVKYFVSEWKIQKLMLDNYVIGYFRYFVNVGERMVLQLLMPNWLRGVIFRKFARK